MKALDRLEELKGKLDSLEQSKDMESEIEELKSEIEDISDDIEYGEEFSALEKLGELFLEMHGKSMHLHSEDYTMEKMRIIFRDNQIF